MPALVWAPLTEADLPDLQRLAVACLRADGGLPHLAGARMLRELFLTGVTTAARDELDELVAAASALTGDGGTVTTSGLVHPSFRGAGLGDALMSWARQQAAGLPLRVVTEALTPEADRLYAAHGLVQTFAETVMRHDLASVPRVPRPAGLRSVPFRDEAAPLFHAAYLASFAERPNFPDPTQQQWLGFLHEDVGFRPELSRVLLDAAGAPAGFVMVSDGWVEQVGVVPAWRGRGLGAHLVARSLSALARSGAEEAWLTVNTNNPRARALYERLGFLAHGTRARYAAPATAVRGAPG